MTDEEAREAIEEMTNLPRWVDGYFKALVELANTAHCPGWVGLKEKYNDFCTQGEDNECVLCWLEALRHD